MGGDGRSGGSKTQTARKIDPNYTPTSVEGKILAAYEQIMLAKERNAKGGFFSAYVDIAQIREKVNVSREAFDKAMRTLDRDRNYYTNPEENQKTLSERERKSAVNIGGRDRHLFVSARWDRRAQ